MDLVSNNQVNCKFHGMNEVISLKKGDLIMYVPVYGGQFLAIFLDKKNYEYKGGVLTILEQTGNIKNIRQAMIFKCKIINNDVIVS